MKVIDYAIEHPVAFLGICGVLILQGWALHKTRRISQQIPRGNGVVLSFPQGGAA